MQRRMPTPDLSEIHNLLSNHAVPDDLIVVRLSSRAKRVKGGGKVYERAFGATDALFAEGHYRKAIEVYDQAIRANSEVADVHVVDGPHERKGRAHEELGQYELAVKSYSEVLRSHPTPFN